VLDLPLQVTSISCRILLVAGRSIVASLMDRRIKSPITRKSSGQTCVCLYADTPHNRVDGLQSGLWVVIDKGSN
jgi:hypothetical protein